MTVDGEPTAHDPERAVRILSMRDAGVPWKDIAEAFGITRQQARYAYQLAKRAERRSERRRQS